MSVSGSPQNCMSTRPKVFVLHLWSGGHAFFSSRPFLRGRKTDDPFSIRVESNLVLVHTEVYNGHSAIALTDNVGLRMRAHLQPTVFRARLLLRHSGPCLGVSDFHLSADGVEQKIESVQYEREPLMAIRDDRGFHGEWSHSPRGKWSSIDSGMQRCNLGGRHRYLSEKKVEKGKSRAFASRACGRQAQDDIVFFCWKKRTGQRSELPLGRAGSAESPSSLRWLFTSRRA
jgi:hypothetical protein